MTQDLFTSLGTPWASFFILLRRKRLGKRPRGPREGDLVSCPGCRKTFIRTELDPVALQVCQVCDHDRREGIATRQALSKTSPYTSTKPRRFEVVRKLRGVPT